MDGGQADLRNEVSIRKPAGQVAGGRAVLYSYVASDHSPSSRLISI